MADSLFLSERDEEKDVSSSRSVRRVVLEEEDCS